MTRKLIVAVVAVAGCLAAAGARADVSGPADGQTPAAQAVKAKLDALLAERKADAAARAKVDELWSKLPVGELETLARLVESLAAVEPAAAKLAELCAAPKTHPILAPQDWLKDAKTPPLIAANLRLWYARWLVHSEMFDEALEQLAGLKPSDVAAPSTLLFYQGVAQHSLLDRENGLKTLAKLLETPEAGPRRYAALARLLEEDLKALQDESLDHIARRMGDVRRRLDLGRAGKKVRGIEDGIIESLDKIIKKLEEQQQQAGAGAGMQDNIRSSRPAPDSMPIGGKGPGDVQKRNIGSGADWGDLPPAEREKALQQLGRDTPAHYRDVIEEYFRRLAAIERE
jgi:hypothetical protein